MTEKRKMMEAVYTNGFAVDEARLFLDTHPDDKEALAYYQKKMNLFHQAVQRYEEKYGPILVESAANGGWGWAKTPWPWEGGM